MYFVTESPFTQGTYIVSVWCNPGGQYSCLLLPSRMGERIGRVKAWKLMGWAKDSLRGKAKAVCVTEANKGIHSQLPIGRQVSSHVQESRAPPHVMVTWEVKCRNPERSPFPLLSPSSRPCPLTASCPPQPSHWWGDGRSREGLDAVWALLTAAHTSLCYYQHCFGHKSKTQHHMSCYEEN